MHHCGWNLTGEDVSGLQRTGEQGGACSGRTYCAADPVSRRLPAAVSYSSNPVDERVDDRVVTAARGGFVCKKSLHVDG